MTRTNVNAGGVAAAERAARLAVRVLEQADAMADLLDETAAALREAHTAGVPVGDSHETGWVTDGMSAAATMLRVVIERAGAATMSADLLRRDLADLATDAGEGTPAA